MIALESLLEEIEQKKQELSGHTIDDPGYKACKIFVNTKGNRIHFVEDLMKIDIWNFMKCYLYVKTDGDIDIQQAALIADSFQNILGDLSYYDFGLVFCSIELFLLHEKSDRLLNFIMEPNRFDAQTYLTSIKNEKLPLSKFTNKVVSDEKLFDCLERVRTIAQNNDGFQIFVDFLDQYQMLGLDIFEFILWYKKMIRDKNMVDDIGDQVSQCLGTSKSIQREASHEFFSKSYSLDDIKSKYDVVQKFVVEVPKKTFERLDYNQAIRLLKEAAKSKEITNPKEIIKNIADKDLKRKVLLWIQEKNAQYYHDLESELERLNSDSVSDYIAVLKKYGINMNITQISSIKHNAPEIVDKMLKMLPISAFSLEQIIKILQVTDLDTVQRVRNCLKLGCIQPNVLANNLDLFVVGSDKLQKMENSCNLLTTYGVRIKAFSHASYILWGDPVSFQQNIIHLFTYGLLDAVSSTSELDFLLDKEMFEKIDHFIEFGYYKFLKQNLSLLCFSHDRIKRLELLRAMEIPIDDIETLYRILDNNEFIMKTDEIDQCFFDVIPYKKPFHIQITIDELEAKSVDHVTVNVGNNTLSLPKIKRMLSQNYSMGEAIFYGRNYSEEEYEKIVHELSSDARK